MHRASRKLPTAALEAWRYTQAPSRKTDPYSQEMGPSISRGWGQNVGKGTPMFRTKPLSHVPELDLGGD